MIGENEKSLCYQCGLPVQVFGCQFCEKCYYPGINEDWRYFSDLVAEGHPVFKAKVMAGIADPNR